MIGQTIAHYHLTAKLGQGGMGEVYRATDAKLDREVAIKVLPESFAQNKERLARFEREAKALAALNHPNIAGIYGLEQSGDTQALILEMVEGEDLSERLKRGPLPVDEALEVCKQIAEALEAAHEKGIIHRDLKPGNIKLLPDGRVKVLDFGLAKVVSDTSSTVEGSTVLEDSPTVSTKGQATMPGVLLGTAGYMSPEQARGEAVDKRSDIWSFGVVLFECLTGERLFPGETVTDSIGALLHKEVDWSQVPAETPPTIHLLLRKCLAKERKRRLQDIGDGRIDLEQAISDPSSSFVRLSEGALRETSAGGGRQRLATGGLLVAVALLAVGVTWFLKPTTAPLVAKSGPIRHMLLNVGLSPVEELLVDFGTAIRMSPDEETLAYMVLSGTGNLTRQLYVNRLDELDPKPKPLPETAGVYSFCFSPDGKEIAFLVRDMLSPAAELKIISLQDGFVRTVQKSLAIPVDVSWNYDSIVFGSLSGQVFAISLSSTGAKPEPLTVLLEGEATHKSPQLIAGGSAVLYTAHDGFSDFNRAKIMIRRLPDGDTIEVKRGGYDARYLSSGHLVYVREGRLFVAAFDENQLTLREDPVPLGLDEVATVGLVGHFDVSPKGTLVYLRGRVRDRHQIYEDTEVPLSTLEWIDRQGTSETLMPADYYQSFRLSPDGRYLAYALNDGTQSDINVYDINNKVDTQLTSNDSDEVHPIWSPDSKFIVFSSNCEGSFNLYWVRIAEPKKDYRLTDSPNFQVAESWNPKTPEIVIMESNPTTGTDLRIVHLEGSEVDGWSQAAIENLIATDAGEYSGQFSPNGDWLAYGSTINKQAEVFVRPYPLSSGLPTQVSKREAPSNSPRWSTAGLLFANEVAGTQNGQVYRVPYRIEGDSFAVEPAVEWPEGRFHKVSKLICYDPDPSGQRILVRKKVENPDVNKGVSRIDGVVLFENFSAYLEKKVPTSKMNP